MDERKRIRKSLANKLNSGEKFNTNTNFETELTLIRTPSASSGKGKERFLGRRNAEAFLKAKRVSYISRIHITCVVPEGLSP